MASPDPILEAWSELVERAPGRSVLVSPGALGEAILSATLVEIERSSLRLAERMIGLSQTARPIALSVPNGPLFFAAFLAVRRLGRAAMLLDSQAPTARQREDARRLGAIAVVSSGSGWQSADDAVLRAVEESDRGPGPPPADTALIKLTSGSTGDAQGIATSSANLLADDRNLSSTMEVSVDDRILAAIPLSHSYGFASVALPCLLRGNLLVIPPEGRPLGALSAARSGDVTFLPTVPSFLDALLRSERPPGLPPDLRLLITAGAPLSPDTASHFRERYEHPVQPFYGASECGGIAFDRDGEAGVVGALGTPVDGVEISLLPAEGRPGESPGASPGTVGVVEVASDAVAMQYLPTPTLALANGRYRTSDRACLENGLLRMLGRIDEMVNVRGLKVHPREVEEVMSSMPGVHEAAVLGLPGRGGVSLRAVIAVAPEGPSEAQIRRWCLERLARHKVPRSIVRTETLPRTERGKLDRPALLEMLGAAEKWVGEGA